MPTNTQVDKGEFRHNWASGIEMNYFHKPVRFLNGGLRKSQDLQKLIKLEDGEIERVAAGIPSPTSTETTPIFIYFIDQVLLNIFGERKEEVLGLKYEFQNHKTTQYLSRHSQL